MAFNIHDYIYLSTGHVQVKIWHLVCMIIYIYIVIDAYVMSNFASGVKLSEEQSTYAYVQCVGHVLLVEIFPIMTTYLYVYVLNLHPCRFLIALPSCSLLQCKPWPSSPPPSPGISI